MVTAISWPGILQRVMPGFVKKGSEHRHALDRVREWTRARFALGEDTTIVVTELVCAVPGCPPLDTVVVFWTACGRHHFKVFKPVAEIVPDDLPPAWMRDALVERDGIGCECC
jgi:nitrate reductase delta subunit